MEQNEPRPLLRFARQWTLTSRSISNAGATTLDYPSRHAESPSPLGRSWAPVTPSPNRARRRPPMKEGIGSGSTSSLPLSELSVLTLQGAARHADASLKPTSRPASAGASGKSVAEESAQAVLSASDADRTLFWRCQAQRFEAACTALEQELSAVYRFLAKDAAGIHRALAASSHRSLVAVGSACPTYEAVVQERNVARLEVAREREKNYLLRHRLREVEAEVQQLQKAHDHYTGNQVASAALKRGPPLRNSAPSWAADPSRYRRSESRPRSSSRSSAQFNRYARRSPAHSSHRRTTRQSTLPSARREESLRPVPVALSPFSARSRGKYRGRWASPASVSPLAHCGTAPRALTASAEASAPCESRRAHSAHTPLQPSRQAPHDYEAEARDLLTSLLGTRSFPSGQLQRVLCGNGTTGLHGPRTGDKEGPHSPHRRVLQSGLLSAGAALGEEGEGDRRLAHDKARRSADARLAIRDDLLLWPTPSQRMSGAGNDASTRDPSIGATHSRCEMPLVTRATRSSVSAAREALAVKGTPSGLAEEGEWIVWRPDACEARQRPADA
ncbi:hypothetical protein LSCM1_00081 [Leishmania martiniquensis]|uniref:Uncharacterized protein n=1 Tax=Leishmania martiniquensis TaxID=1580590 RepID=A0A836GHB3_9TRYP|nr:hypothetical protein LSCM1_00081 [Leishmania martiniquensis]